MNNVSSLQAELEKLQEEEDICPVCGHHHHHGEHEHHHEGECCHHDHDEHEHHHEGECCHHDHDEHEHTTDTMPTRFSPAGEERLSTSIPKSKSKIFLPRWTAEITVLF